MSFHLRWVRPRAAFAFWLGFVGLLALSACGGGHSDSSSQETQAPGKGPSRDAGPEAQSLDGEALARARCGGCHQYPEPSLLDQASWRDYILPRMGYLMGVYEGTARDSLIEEGPGGEVVRQAGIFPRKPQIEPAHWKAIQGYYLEHAPDSLRLPRRAPIAQGLERFRVVKPGLTYSPPSTTMLRFAERGELYVGDANTQSLMHLDADLQLIKAGKVREGAVHLEDRGKALWVTVMGSFSPTDAPKGFIMTLPKNGGRPRVPIKGLRRPVHAAYGDLTGDGLPEVVVSEFAKWAGRLSLFVNQGGNRFRRKVLIDQSGAVRSYLRDFNGDGRLDIVALFGQGNEGIWILYNQGGGRFRVEQALAFSPSHGSSFFDLVDFDSDGDWDILYTAGDNADFKPVLKPYHGVYLFENDGQNQFSQRFFQQLNGAYGAVLQDFDLDGDQDLAAISFFPDFHHRPGESFVYFENQGDWRFTATTLEDPTMGRWIVMDSGDPDGDGDQDLVLGSLTFEVVPPGGWVQRWVREGLPFVLLENKTR